MVKSAPASANLKTVRKHKGKKSTKTVPSKSFKTALYKALPSKEIRDFVDTPMDLTVLANYIKYDKLTNIQQGTQSNQRLGCRVHASYLHLRGTISNQLNTSSIAFRIMVVQNRSGTGSVLNTSTFSDLYQNYAFDPVAPTSDNATARYKVNRQKYRVFYDRILRIEPQQDMGFKKIHANVRLNQKLFYAPADSASIVPANGDIYVLYHLFDPANTAGSRNADLSCQSRLFFRDS